MLPNIPTFVFGDAVLTPSLPITPWVRSLRVTGGDTEAESSTRAGYVVRRDELLTFDLRFHEEEWPDIQEFMDFAQSGLSFIWYPDTNDLTFGFEVCLDAPASGSTYQSSLDDFIRVQHLRITLMQPGNPAIPWHELNPFERRIPIVPPGPLPPVTLEINPQINPLEEDETLQLTYEFRNSRREIVPDLVPTSWESDNPTAASVDPDTGLVTANDGIPFTLLNQNLIDSVPWANAGTPVVDAGEFHDKTFWRVASTSLPKQQFAVENDGDDYFITVFVRADGEDEDDETIPLGTFEGGIYDVTNAVYKARWRFTVSEGGAIAMTTLAGTMIRQCTLTDLTRAFTFKASALEEGVDYEFRLRDGGTATSLLCAYAILTAAQDAVAAVKAFYDVGAIDLESNDVIIFVDDDTIVEVLPEVPVGTTHIAGKVTFFGVGGGGGGSSSCGGGGGKVDGNTVIATGFVTWSIGTGGNAGAPSGVGGVQTIVTLSGFGTVINAGGGGGAGPEFGGGSTGGPPGSVGGVGCGLDGSCGGGGGGAGAAGPGTNAAVTPTCPSGFTAAGQGGSGFPIIFEHRFIALLGGGGGGGGFHEGTCGASPGAGGNGGGGIGGDNGPGGAGADFFGGGGGNAQEGGKGTLFMLYRPGEAVVTHTP